LSADCRLTVTVRPAAAADEVAAAKDLRLRVFCDEQGVSRADELDEHDESATHVVALDESGVVATCRLRWMDADLKLERMAVEDRLRGSGVGSRLLAGAEQIAHEAGASQMVLNAQTRARGFYAANGYEAEGGMFMDAGIEHVRMTKRL
jgi:predicted GNAT family N-acyltransferase